MTTIHIQHNSSFRMPFEKHLILSAFQIPDKQSNIKREKFFCSTREYNGTVNRTEFFKDTKQKRAGWEKNPSLLTILWYYSGKATVDLWSKGLSFPGRAPEATNLRATGAENRVSVRAANGKKRMKEVGGLPRTTVWLAVYLPFQVAPVKPSKKWGLYLCAPNISSRLWKLRNSHKILTTAY